MKVVSGECQSGKTTLLINEAIKDENHIIVVRDNLRLRYLKNRILEKFNIEAKIITYPTFRNDYFGRGRAPGDKIVKNFYIEDFNDIIDRAFPNCNISMINFTSSEHLLPVIFSKMSSKALYDAEEYWNKALEVSNINLCNYNALLIHEMGQIAAHRRVLASDIDNMRTNIENYNNLPWFKKLFSKIKEI